MVANGQQVIGRLRHYSFVEMSLHRVRSPSPTPGAVASLQVILNISTQNKTKTTSYPVIVARALSTFTIFSNLNFLTFPALFWLKKVAYL